MEYKGRLAPFMEEIRALHDGGMPPVKIARKIFDRVPLPPYTYERNTDERNIYALAGVIRFALRLTKKQQVPVSVLQKRVFYYQGQLRQAEAELNAALAKQ